MIMDVVFERTYGCGRRGRCPSRRATACFCCSLMRWGQQVRHPVVKRSIEKLINDASGGEHSDVVYLLNERIVARADEERARFLAETATVGQADLLPLEGSQQSTEETFQQLRSLATEGIDVGFLEALPHDLVKPLPAVRSDVEPEALLTMNGELLHQLYLEQTKRMATASTAHLGNVPLPGEMECSLGELHLVRMVIDKLSL